MRAGTLRLLATFKRQSETQDAAGQRVDTWTSLGTARVSVRPIAGKEYFNASGERAEVTHELHIRYDSDLSSLAPRDRAYIGSRIFDIQSVINLFERNREMKLMCTEHTT